MNPVEQNYESEAVHDIDDTMPSKNKPTLSTIMDDEQTLPTIEAPSDSSNTSSIAESLDSPKHFFTRHSATRDVGVGRSRSCSHAVTHARTTIPKPPLPIKAARAINNCVLGHGKKEPKISLSEQTPARAPPKRSRSCLKQATSPSSEGKKVHFGSLEMRNYEVVLGDHPDCSSGPPISLGWAYAESNPISVERYEEIKPSSSRRSMDQLELNYFVRKRMLRRESLVSDEDMRNRIDDVNRIQKQRLHTKRMQPVYKLREAILIDSKQRIAGILRK